ncbi:MAG: hect e3 ubiquitin [Edafosvirus sp.]|uniref:Hect e3 ubiquitin n=1 Tax=Edafosvirus sp. TaxID=2487765 RepID=A0A3G4ZT67_9VIRU|nr:MAG: hect e3 ubiquitin [Edafosvirus sp.]
MDDNKILHTIPKDLLMIIISYDPVLIFNLPESSYTKYDWYALIKNNFSLTYSKGTTTNNDMMKTYIWNCIKDDLNCDISAGSNHIIIKKTNGELMSCGRNDRNQLGYKTNQTNQLYFGKINALSKNMLISQVNCGTCHTIIKLDSGKLLGIGFHVALGCEDSGHNDQFRKIPNVPKNISQIICGSDYTFILLTDGTLIACGLNSNGRLGCGKKEYITQFTKIDNIPENIVEVACGHSHTIIRLIDGTLMSTGNNLYGQLGHNDKKYRNKFEEIKDIPKNIVQVACGIYHTIIRLTDGTLMGCGGNNYGELGLLKLSHVTTFVQIENIPKNIVEVACGYYYSIIRLTDGTLMSCGENMYGELGHGDNKSRNAFTIIEDIPKNIIQLMCKGQYTLIRLTDDTIMCCGSNQFGQFGNNSSTSKNKFVKVFNINTIKN